MSMIFTRTTSSFTTLSRTQRVRILQNWRDSRFALLRGVFCSTRRLVLLSCLKVVKPAFDSIGYPDHHNPSSALKGTKEIYRFTFNETETNIDADIVIVGSGAGGGVVSATLSEALPGKKIVIIESGEYVPQTDMPVSQDQTGKLTDGPLSSFTTADNTGIVLAGKAWGGSTAINFSATLPLIESIREEWKNVHGLDFATSPEFQSCFDRLVAERSIPRFPYCKR